MSEKLLRLLRQWPCKGVTEKNAQLSQENAALKKELAAKGNIFWAEHKWLGVGQMVCGTIIDGRKVILDTREADDEI